MVAQGHTPPLRSDKIGYAARTKLQAAHIFQIIFSPAATIGGIEAGYFAELADKCPAKSLKNPLFNQKYRFPQNNSVHPQADGEIKSIYSNLYSNHKPAQQQAV
ncbi:hypothetical protein [Bergeriella denitrificans]|uniref:hypothetical protein n=1 Tax=Bergeriella denitrificans TaxID=494 RepID=UPI000824AD64|nr:hypothetical protein [Bergeriella denitrificans]